MDFGNTGYRRIKKKNYIKKYIACLCLLGGGVCACVRACVLGYLGVSSIHRSLAWTTGSLMGVYDLFSVRVFGE